MGWILRLHALRRSFRADSTWQLVALVRMVPAWGMTRYARHLSLVLLEPLDESVRGAIMLQFCVGLGKFRKDLLRELLAEFNTPLVVAVDVPDHALSEDFVFVHGNESAETFRRNVVHHDGVRRVGLRTP